MPPRNMLDACPNDLPAVHDTRTCLCVMYCDYGGLLTGINIAQLLDLKPVGYCFN